jgi:hypothetical protein
MSAMPFIKQFDAVTQKFKTGREVTVEGSSMMYKDDTRLMIDRLKVQWRPPLSAFPPATFPSQTWSCPFVHLKIPADLSSAFSFAEPAHTCDRSPLYSQSSTLNIKP